MPITLLHGDCLEVLPTLAANSADSIVCDPPYGLSFMGKDWDHGVPGVHFWEAALRVAKPGAYLLAFGGTRTFHRLTCAIEDAGWEIRDCLMWLYGSGFPKSASVSKLIDKAAGAEREVIGSRPLTGNGQTMKGGNYHQPESDKDKTIRQTIYEYTAPATDAARMWDGWGTALKPAWEPIIMARKPLVGTVADNVLAWGTGGLAIDKCRIDGQPRNPGFVNPAGSKRPMMATGNDRLVGYESPQGRWPANLVLDEEAAAMLDEMSGERTGAHGGNGAYRQHKWMNGDTPQDIKRDDQGGASRFFYCAKSSKRDRGEGNSHPTVKPESLCRWLVRLVTPPGGVVLDPFMGSGSTGKAAKIEGFSFIGIDTEAEYLEIARRRIEAAQEEMAQMQPALLEVA